MTARSLIKAFVKEDRPGQHAVLILGAVVLVHHVMGAATDSAHDTPDIQLVGESARDALARGRFQHRGIYASGVPLA